MSGIDRDDIYLVDVIGFGEEVDIYPLLEEAVLRCRYKHDFTMQELAVLLRKDVRGEYIPADILDRIEGRQIGSITGWVIRRLQSAYRIEQLKEVNVLWLRPYVFLDNFDTVPRCAAARALSERWLEPEELTPFPLHDCDATQCDCAYHSVSHGRGPIEHPDWAQPKAATMKRPT